MSETKILVSVEEATRFTKEVLEGNGLSSEYADVVSKCLIEADLRGVDTHGPHKHHTPLIPRGQQIAELHETDPRRGARSYSGSCP